jgi:predicted nucleic-acid-binding Zn-ribbon protein
MAEAKTCPKCNGSMMQGGIMKINEYSASGQYMYAFSPDNDPGPDLSKLFSGKPLSKYRKTLVAFCCEQCGFVEFYGIAAGGR